MKQTLTLFAALVLLAVGATAQKLSYSAVVRNSANELQANKTLTVGVSIANNATGNPAVYSETHSGVQTNQNGLLTLTIGEGSNVDGNLSNVTWSSAYITTTYTIDGSTVTNTVAVNAVPYALYAENSGTSTPVNDGTLTIKQGENTLGTFTANQAGQTNVNIPAAPTVNDGTLTIKQGENTLGTFTANQSGTTEVNIPTAPAVPVVNDGVLTIQKNGITVGTFSANQSTPVTVNITITPQDIIDAVGQMTDEQKSALCSALNCGGGETPTSVDGQPCPGTPTVTDHEGNVYNTVQIGDQCWTKENMRVTTSPSTGTYLIPAVNTDNTYTGKQARWYDNDSVTYAPKNYGLMYNWNAAVDTFNTTYGETSVNTDQDNKVSVTFTGHRRGICPEGWHVPSHAEWTDLTNYLNSCSNEAGQYKYRCGQQEGYIAKALASTTGWNTDEATEDYPCQLRYNPATTNNASGFGAIPAGRIDEIGFNRASGAAYFWSATQNLSNYPYVRDLNGASPNVFVTTYSSERSCSVRCLKDETSGGGGGGETPTTETCPTISVPSVTAGENNYILTATITLNGVAMDKISNVYFDIVDGANSGNNTRQWAATITPNGDGTATATANFPKQGENLTDMGTVEYNFYASTSLIMKSYCTVANDCGVVASEEYTYTTEVAPSTDCPTFISGETELQTSDSKYIALISYTGGSGNETVSGSYTVANDETQLVLGQTLFIDRTSKQVRVEIAQSAVSLNAGEDLLVEITLTDGTCTQSTATGVYTEPAEGDNCPQWGDVTETSFLVLNNNTVQLNLYGHNLADVQREDFEVMLNGTTEQTFTSMEIGDAGDYIIFTGDQIVGVDYADATYRITYTPSQNCEQSSGLEVEGSFAICPYFVEATSITAASAYEFVVSTPYAKSGDFIIENGGYKVYTTPNLGTPVATVQMTPATQIVVTADNDELIAIVDLTDLITPEALALLDGQTLYIQPFLTTMECGMVTGEVLQYIVQEPTTDFTCGTSTVSDHEGNVYHTVQIGDQCWTRENMRATTSPSTGTYLVNTTSNQYTYTGKMAKWYNNDSVAAVAAGYGLLYNWNAAVDTFNTAYRETSVNTTSSNAVSVTFAGHRRGICPEGWHIPSDAEWTTLTEYVGANYACGGNSSNKAKALASTTGWSTNGATEDSPCELRYNPATTNNASGFGAVPAGTFASNFSGAGDYTYFWSATHYSGYYAYNRGLYYYGAFVNSPSDNKVKGFSVRCLKD